MSNTDFQVFLTSNGIPISGNQSFHEDVLQIVNLKPLLYWYPTITHFPKKSEFPYHPLFLERSVVQKKLWELRHPQEFVSYFPILEPTEHASMMSKRIAEMSQHHSCSLLSMCFRCSLNDILATSGYCAINFGRNLSTFRFKPLNPMLQSFSISIVSCLVEKWLCSYDKFVHRFGSKLRKFLVLSQRNRCVTWAVLLSWGHESAMKNWELKFGPGNYFSDCFLDHL